MRTGVRICLTGICAAVCRFSEGAVEAGVRLELNRQPYYVGEDMPFSMIVTNRSNRTWVSFEHQQGDPNRLRGGIIFTLTDCGDGRDLIPTRDLGCSSSSVSPGAAEDRRCNLAYLFSVTNAGCYRLQARILQYRYEIEVVDGKDVAKISPLLDIQSPSVEFEVRGVDAELAARVEGLLKSGKRREQMEGLALLATARAELFRRAAPALPPLVRSRDARVRAAALRVLLARVELTEPLSDAELYEALDAASRESDEAIRLAAAKALAKVRYPYRPSRSNALYAFVNKRMEPWVKEEPSAECRRILVAENNLGLDTMSGIIRGDPSPQVRAAAVRRLSDFAPGNLLKVAGSFGKLSGEVEMDGKRQPLAAFVAEECARVRARIDQTEGKGNVPAQAPAR